MKPHKNKYSNYTEKQNHNIVIYFYWQVVNDWYQNIKVQIINENNNIIIIDEHFKAWQC